jgi:hypothetical protein
MRQFSSFVAVQALSVEELGAGLTLPPRLGEVPDR